MDNKQFPENLFDKHGNRINDDDIIYDGEHYFRIYWDDRGKIEAISPTFGYLRNPDTEDYSKYERIGTFEESEHLILVDGVY